MKPILVFLVIVMSIIFFATQCTDSPKSTEPKNDDSAVNKPEDKGVASVPLAKMPPLAQEIFVQRSEPDKDGNNLIVSVRLQETDKRFDNMKELTLNVDSGRVIRFTRDNDGLLSTRIKVVENEFVSLVQTSNRLIQSKKDFTETIFVKRSAVKVRRQPFDLQLFRRNVRVPLDISFQSIIDNTTLPDIRKKSLMVTDLSVIADPTRTFDPCAKSGKADGAWSFQTLINNMVNGNGDAQTFLINWVQTSLFSASLLSSSNDAATDRKVSRERFVRAWMRNSGLQDPGPTPPASWADSALLVEAFPVRLTAIINRIDLRDNSAYTGADDAFGEGRFVFCFAEPGDCNGGNNGPGTMTFIFEYGVPLQGCFSRLNYAKKWWALREVSFGDAFNAQLESITNVFASANAAPSRPNGSSLNHLRTNDFLAGQVDIDANPWDIRQFEIDAATHLLKLTPPNREPMVGSNGANAERTFFDHDKFVKLVQFANGLPFPFPENPVYEIPVDLQGNHAPMPVLPSTQYLWRNSTADQTNVFTPANRREFSLNTCSGCHKSETDNVFTHVKPRRTDLAAQLSGFETGMGNDDDPTDDDTQDIGTIQVNDIVPGNAEPKFFNEALRRGQDLEKAIFGSLCIRERPFPQLLVSIVETLRFAPVNMEH